MGCNEYQELISRMLDEDLSSAEQAALHEHLAVCPECRALYESFQALSAAVGGELEDPPARLHANIMAEIRRAEIRKKNRISRPVKVLLTTAACLAVIVGLSLSRGLLQPKGSSQSSPVLAGSNFFEAARSMPAEAPQAAAGGYRFAENAEEEAASTDTTADPGQAAPYAAAAVADDDAGVPRYDLSDRLSADDLLEQLGGSERRVDVKDLSGSVCCILVVEDAGGPCEVTVYERDGALLYTDPASGGILLADAGPAALEALLNS